MRNIVVGYCVAIVLGASVTAVPAFHRDLAAEWTFSEAEGPMAVDSSGHANDATLSQAERVVDQRGPAIFFPSLPAPPAWVSVPVSAASTLYGFDAGITLEAFIKPDVLPPEGLVPLGRIRYIVWGDDDVFALQLRADDPGQATLRGGINCGRSGAGLFDVSAAVAFPHERAGVFTHVALTFGAGTLRLYIDGTSVAEVQDAGDPACGSRVGPLGFRSLVLVGGDETTQLDPFGTLRTFRGVIDDVRIWRRALSPQEIADAAGRPPCAGDAECDDRDLCTADSCDPETGCVQARIPGVDGVQCEVEKLRAPAVCEGELLRKVERLRRKFAGKVLRFLKRVARSGNPARIEKLLARADAKLARLDEKLATGKLAEQIDPVCAARVRALITEARAAVASLQD